MHLTKPAVKRYHSRKISALLAFLTGLVGLVVIGGLYVYFGLLLDFKFGGTIDGSVVPTGTRFELESNELFYGAVGGELTVILGTYYYARRRKSRAEGRRNKNVR